MTPVSPTFIGSLVVSLGLFACVSNPPQKAAQADPATVSPPFVQDRPAAPAPCPERTQEADPAVSCADSSSDSSQLTFDSHSLQVGSATDGVSWTGAEVIEQSTSGAVTITIVQLVFDGQGAPPVTTAQLSADGQRVTLVMAGVRAVTAPVPLVSGEGGRILAEPKIIDRGPVHTLARTFYGDDSGVQLEVQLSTPVSMELRVGAQGRSVELLLRNSI